MADETVYKSLYTGVQIDEAIASALEMKKNGPFLPLAGETLNGPLYLNGNYIEGCSYITTRDLTIENDVGNGACITAIPPIMDGTVLVAERLELRGNLGDELVQLGGIYRPEYKNDAANKEYVDQAIKPLIRTVTIPASGWIGNTQIVTVDGILADETKQRITPIPSHSSQAAYIDSVVICTAQGANSLTFACDTVPTADLTVYVTVEEVRVE